MAEPTFSPMGGDDPDDLPRTFRREKEAREREAREREAKERDAQARVAAERQAKERTAAARQAAAASAPAPSISASVAPSLSATPEVYRSGPQVYDDPSMQPAGIAEMPYPASVRRFDVPFMHLVTFFLKAVVAAIPALFLLMAILWAIGQGLSTFFPELVKMKILIGFGG